jgi:adenosine deaminase
VDRIDHGNASMQDPALIRRLVKEQIALTVCPLSNTRLCVVVDMKNHPLPQMLEAGIKVTVNSDDPAYFGGYLNENYEAISDILGNNIDLLALLARNSFSASFLEASRRDELIAEVDAYMQQFRL